MNNAYLQPLDFSIPTDSLISFETYLFKEGKNVSTIENSLINLKRLFREVPSLLEENINEYFLKLLKKGRSAAYLNNYISVLRSYGHFLKIDEYKNLKFFKTKSRLKSTMSDSEIEAFLALPPQRQHMGSYLWHYDKMTLFWSILAHTGARTGEIATLTVENVDFGRQVLRVHGKTGERNVPLSSALIDLLKNYIEKINGKYLFPSMRIKSEPVERATWHYDFKQRLTRLGIKRTGLTPYSLRHSFITRMLEEDINIFKIQKIVGHKKIETTAIYTHMTTKDMVMAIQKDPLNRQNLTIDQKIVFGKELLEKAGFSIVECRKVGENIKYEVKI